MMDPMMMTALSQAGPAAAGTGMSPQMMQQQALGSSIAAMEPNLPNPPQVPYTQAARAQNPAFSEMVMQMLMGGQAQQQPTLGQLIGGR